MKITIDNFDGAGVRDHTATVASQPTAQVVRVLNRAAELRFAVLADPSLPVPATGARVVVQEDDATALFTGYVTAQESCEYLGWGERGPQYRIAFAAVSDE